MKRLEPHTMIRVAVFTQNAFLAHDVKESLKGRSFTVETLEASTKIPYLALLDVNAEDIEEISAFARTLKHSPPIVYIVPFLSKKYRLPNAYGYVTKPLDEDTLYSTLQVAVYKHAYQLKDKHFQGTRLILNQRCQYDVAHDQFFCDNQSIALTPKETVVAKTFIARPNKILKHKEIHKSIWGDKPYEASLVRSAMAILSRKFPMGIITHKNIGYSLNLRG